MYSIVITVCKFNCIFASFKHYFETWYSTKSLYYNYLISFRVSGEPGLSLMFPQKLRCIDSDDFLVAFFLFSIFYLSCSTTKESQQLKPLVNH